MPPAPLPRGAGADGLHRHLSPAFARIIRLRAHGGGDGRIDGIFAVRVAEEIEFEAGKRLPRMIDEGKPHLGGKDAVAVDGVDLVTAPRLLLFTPRKGGRGQKKRRGKGGADDLFHATPPCSMLCAGGALYVFCRRRMAGRFFGRRAFSARESPRGASPRGGSRKGEKYTVLTFRRGRDRRKGRWPCRPFSFQNADENLRCIPCP